MRRRRLPGDRLRPRAGGRSAGAGLDENERCTSQGRAQRAAAGFRSPFKFEATTFRLPDKGDEARAPGARRLNSEDGVGA
jgi:hypothetical protein